MSEEIPDGWATARVSDVFAAHGGGTPNRATAAFWRGRIPWLSSGDIKSDLITGSSETITDRGLAESTARLCRPGSVLVVVRSGILKHTLPVAMLGRAAAINQDIKCFDCGDDDLNRWLATAWRASAQAVLAENREGTTVQSVKMETLAGFPLAVPPLAEQRRIVAKLDEVLGRVGACKKRLDRTPVLLKRFRQSVLAAACSGDLTKQWREKRPEVRQGFEPRPQQKLRRGPRGANLSYEGALLIDDEMKDLPATWTYARADQLVESGTLVTYGIVLPGPEVEGGVPYVRGQDVEDGWLRTDALRHTTAEIASKHQRSSLRHGDVLLCIIRNLRVAIVPCGMDGANITQGMVRMRPDSSVVLRQFLAAYLASPQAQEWMKRRYFGMDMPRINVEDARAIPVALPPLQEQVEIVRLLRQAQEALAQIETVVNSASRAVEALPRAILSKAFSGTLVPTEAEVARLEGRDYEPASALLERIRASKARERPVRTQRRKAMPLPTRARRRA